MSFAAAATKRLGSITDGRLASPSACARRASVTAAARTPRRGYALRDVDAALGKPGRYAEIHALFAEGKVQVDACKRQYGGLQAQDAVDFYRAVAALGIDRGVSAFQRYAFQMRNGLAYFAVALDRVPVVAHGEVQALLSPIDQWMQKLRGKAADENAPASVRRAVRRLDEAVVALSTRGAAASMGLLETLGDCDEALGRSIKWAKEAASVLWPRFRPVAGICRRGRVGEKQSRCALAAALASLNTYFGKGKAV